MNLAKLFRASGDKRHSYGLFTISLHLQSPQEQHNPSLQSLHISIPSYFCPWSGTPGTLFPKLTPPIDPTT
ncbi:BgTH12-01859 [Blumeria graminis f. sp. triticale]|uniref:BgTH12-01859 n=1 Tax=Blumeria graminis f. sp. triticale TaxID=1689686 RepID=A0A9W4GDI6_BLUGR|nr:BgTH12-01859 [Blumeria graminis f. sp. triticale]